MRISRKRIYKILNSSSKQTRKKPNKKARKSAYKGGKRRTHSKRHGKKNLRYRSLKRQKGGNDGEGESKKPINTQVASEVDCVEWQIGLDAYGFKNLFDEPGAEDESARDVLAMCPYDEANFKTFEMPPDGNCGWYSILQWLQNTAENNPDYYNQLNDSIKDICGLSGELKCPADDLLGNEKLQLREYKNTDMTLYTAQWKPIVDKLRKYIREDVRHLNIAPDGETPNKASVRLKELNDQYLRDTDLPFVAQELKMTIVTYNGDSELNTWGYQSRQPRAMGIYTSIKLDDESIMYPMPLILKSQPTYNGYNKEGVQAGGHFDVFEAKSQEGNPGKYLPVFRKQMYAGYQADMKKGNTKVSEQAIQAQHSAVNSELIKDPANLALKIQKGSLPKTMDNPTGDQLIGSTTQSVTPPVTPPVSPQRPKSDQQRAQVSSTDPDPNSDPDPVASEPVTTSTATRKRADGKIEIVVTIIAPDGSSTRVDAPGGDTVESAIESLAKGTQGTGTQGTGTQGTGTQGRGNSGTTSNNPAQSQSNTGSTSVDSGNQSGDGSGDSSINPQMSAKDYQEKLGTELAMKIIGNDEGDLNATSTKKFMKVMKIAQDAYKEIKQAASSKPENVEKILTPITSEILKKLYPSDVELIDKATIDGKISKELQDKLDQDEILRSAGINSAEINRILNQSNLVTAQTSMQQFLLDDSSETSEDAKELEAALNEILLEMLDATPQESCNKLTSKEQIPLLELSTAQDQDKTINTLDMNKLKCALDIAKNVIQDSRVQRKIDDKIKEIERTQGNAPQSQPNTAPATTEE